MSISARPDASLPRERLATIAGACLLILLSWAVPAHGAPELLPWVSTLESPSLGGTATAGEPDYVATPRGAHAYRVTTRFRGHDGESLRLEFDVDREIATASMRGYGFSQDEVEAVRARCLASADCTQERLDLALDAYYREHGLRVQHGPERRVRLSVDIPQVVRRNRAAVQPMVVALQELVRSQGFDDERRLAAATAAVQGGLAYRVPQQNENGRLTLGFYTPPRTLEKGYGDCDTKSALLAAVLAGLGEEKLIGIHIPGHYLLGVAREPGEREMSLEYGGRRYVLLEAAGPATRRPGDVAKATRVALTSGQPIRIDPIF
jgi:hypothetical protein